jgi:phosphoribosylanthranilate isomerase
MQLRWDNDAGTMSTESAESTRLRRIPPGVWVKLCGVRDEVMAVQLAALRPDAIGLNFYSRSVRFVERDAAMRIVQALPTDVAAVGVFVNASVQEIVRTTDAVGLSAVQLHGDEPPEDVAELKSLRPDLMVIRAWRVGAEGLAPLAGHLAACEALEAKPDAILIDAHVPGCYGGTGQRAPWMLLRDSPTPWPPLILAGGLTPENVAEAVETVRPWGVDTAGGIEMAPGIKDVARAAAFIAAARSDRGESSKG